MWEGENGILIIRVGASEEIKWIRKLCSLVRERYSS